MLVISEYDFRLCQYRNRYVVLNIGKGTCLTGVILLAFGTHKVIQDMRDLPPRDIPVRCSVQIEVRRSMIILIVYTNEKGEHYGSALS